MRPDAAHPAGKFGAKIRAATLIGRVKLLVGATALAALAGLLISYALGAPTGQIACGTPVPAYPTSPGIGACVHPPSHAVEWYLSWSTGCAVVGLFCCLAFVAAITKPLNQTD